MLVLAGEIASLSLMHANSDKKVLSEKTVSTPTLSPSPVATPIPTPTPTPSPSATPIKTPTPTPRPLFTSEQINGFIDRFGAQYGVDPNVLRYIALCESGFNQFAYNAGYAGLFQFGPATWKGLRAEIGEDTNADLRFNAEEAAQTAAFALSKGKAGIWPNCRP